MTGEPHYFDLMNRYAQAGLRHTLTLDPEADYWWICLCSRCSFR
ncbi:MAG: hypothetical protein V8T87_11480 [Victivallales bacterium]